MICEKHGEYEDFFLNIHGKKISRYCPECFEEDRAENIRLDELDKKRAADSILKARMGYSKIPKKYLNFEIEDCRKIYPRETNIALTWLANAPENAASLILIGPKGTGKTTLACVLLKIWSSSSMGLFTTMFAMSKKSYTDGTEEFITPPLLVIDEAGRQMGTDAEKNRIFEIINERYNDLKPTIFITNMKKSDFEEVMGSTVYDRIQENHTEIKMIRESLRRKRNEHRKTMPYNLHDQ